MTYVLQSRLFWSAVFLAALGAAEPAAAQRPILKTDPSVRAAFRAVVAQPSLSTVKVLCKGKEAALGTVVGEDGWIVTKFSELTEKITVKTRDGKIYDAEIKGVEDKYDLAMLKIKAKGLKPISWVPAKSAEQGDWLAASGLGDDPVAVGIVSVEARKPDLFEMPAPAPKKDSGFMGVQLADDDEGGAPKIGIIEKGKAAANAGLKVGDLVLTVQGETVASVEGLIRKIQNYKAGDVIKLKIKRDGKEKDIQVTLGKRPPNPDSRGDIQNSMGSTLSNRRGGFPSILQTDLVIPQYACGGPAVNLDGKAVGVFIARAGRTESYVIPSEDVQNLLVDLKSGKLKPKPPEKAVNVKDLEDAMNNAKRVLDAKQKKLSRAKEADERDEEAIKKMTAEVEELKKKYEDAQKAFKTATDVLPKKKDDAKDE